MPTNPVALQDPGRSNYKINTMKLFKSLVSLTLATSCLFAFSEGKKKDEDATAQAIKDMQAGMAGLKEASKNPAMLAQLMRDLQVSIPVP